MNNKFNDNYELYTEGFLKEAAFLEDVDINFQSLYLKNPENPKEKNYGDPFNSYELNSFGYRSQEFKKVPLITAGCSITYGVGVPIEAAWPDLVSNSLNLEHVNLAVPGWSAQAIVDNLFKYFYKYGNPEVLIVMFPDFNRLMYVSQRDYAVIPPHTDNQTPLKINHCQLPDVSVEDRPKYSKTPHKILDFIVPGYGLLQAFKAINTLITYCKSSNIKLIWSTWDFQANNLILAVANKINKDSYKNYVPLKWFYSGKDTELKTCHSKYKKIYKNNFDMGYDGTTNGLSMPHPGVHFHLHFSEQIIKKLKEIK